MPLCSSNAAPGDDETPAALRKPLKGWSAEVQRQSSLGLQIDGLNKHTSADWVPNQDGSTSSASMLEIRSYFTKSHQPKQKASFLKSAFLSRGAPEFAEFVSWLDVEAKTWTIFKTFSNGILPSGRRLGAQAIAEHIPGRQAMFFSDGKLSNPSQMGSVTAIETINLKDVVNVNTYMLMAIAASKTRSLNHFGEVWLPELQAEMRSSKLSAEALQKDSELDVFFKTAMGKTVANVLTIWNEESKSDLRVLGIEVVFDNSTYERVCGENRPCMDIRVKIKDFAVERQCSAETVFSPSSLSEIAPSGWSDEDTSCGASA